MVTDDTPIIEFWNKVVDEISAKLQHDLPESSPVSNETKEEFEKIRKEKQTSEKSEDTEKDNGGLPF